MNDEQANMRLVQKMFAAFGQGNLPVALDTFAVNVDFRSPVTGNAPTEIPWAKPRHTREELAGFFEELSENIHMAPMETLHFTPQGERVIVEARNRGTVRSTGRTYEHDWVMVFVVSGGRILKNWHYQYS